ncbi:MAG: alpha/beta fold hydrolase [Gammaproteobacteria bacterium]
MAAGNNEINDIRCRTGGAGRPFVLIHGYLGGGAQWREQLRSPPPGARVTAPCLPGFGDNAGLTAPQSVGGFARAMLRFLTAKKIGRFILLGHSMGGMIAQEMTRQAPERIAALILYATGALGNIPGRFESMAESRRRVLAEGAAAAAARLPAKWLSAGKDGAHYPFAADIAGKAGLSAHLAGLNAMESWDGRAALARIACPTLIVWGDADMSYPRRQIDFLHSHISGSILKIMPGAPHLAHLEFPREFGGILHNFLGQCGTSGGI